MAEANLRGSAEPKALAELRGGLAMAEETKRAEIVEIALAATLGYRTNVISIPQTAPGRDGLHAIESQASGTGSTSRPLECVVGCDGIDRAYGADAAVAGKHLIPEVAWVGAQTPLVDAVVAAEGTPALGEDLKLAPAAEGQIVGAKW